MVKKSTVSIAPWIFSVAASSTDRGIITKVVLGNGTILTVCIINYIFLQSYLDKVYDSLIIFYNMFCRGRE